MSAVRIAGCDLSQFQAKMQSYPAISPCEVDAEVFQGSDRSSLQLLHNRRGGRKMVCRIDFFGGNAVRTRAQSEFEALFLGDEPVEMDIGDGYFYRAVLLSAGAPVTVAEYLTTVEYTLRVTRHTAEQTVSVIPNDAKLLCQSNVAKTDCTIRILYEQMGDARNIVVTLGGNTWSFAPLLTGDLVLDGVNKVFTMGGVNVTGQMIWSDFPYLVPGENTLTLSVEGIVVGNKRAEVTYTPTYL